MITNMGKFDRIIRLTIAFIIIGLYFTNIISGTFGIVILVIAGILVLTSSVGFCPLYMLFKITTCKKEN